MIAMLRGVVAYKNPVAAKGNGFILDVNGVGYRIQATAKLIQKLTLQASTTIYTHHVVREDTQDLYGFTTPAEADLFRMLVSISGIGPKSALQIMETTQLEDLRQAVASNQPKLLEGAADLSPRMAEKVVEGLQGKWKDVPPASEAKVAPGNAEVFDALLQLGFPPVAARSAVNQVAGKGKSSDQMIREALKLLGQQPPSRGEG